MSRLILALPVALVSLNACAPAPSTSEPASLLFDDFNYTSHEDLARNGWVARTAAGWPGIEGARWDGAISFAHDPAAAGNSLLRLHAATDGTATQQAQLCHQRKYHWGTYAARVRFSDAPVSGPDGDQIVQTFYTIVPLQAPLHPDYSEQDFEYLPNGGWGKSPPTLHNTTWETFRPEPDWLQVSASDARAGSLEGWHTLVLQTTRSEVRYFLDGELTATHREPYIPELPMSINFNLWFIRGGLIESAARREYQQDVDWVFHAAGQVLSPGEVERRIAQLRAEGVSFTDTVRPREYASPCDL